MRRIFITGASGCVGHYVLRQLLHQAPAKVLTAGSISQPGSQPHELQREQFQLDPAKAFATLEPPYHVIALVRDPARLRWTPQDVEKMTAQGSQLTVLTGDMTDIDAHREWLSETEGLIHLAAGWSDDATATTINLTQTLRLFELLDPGHCRKILYFSTASLLDRHHHPLEVAGRAGTAYIRSKYEMLMRRSEVKLADRLITLYPTLLFGGSESAPYSHITTGIPDVMAWIPLARFLKLEASFHFIHAADIAQVVACLLQQPILTGDWVLGNPVLTYEESMKQICGYLKRRIYFRIPVPVKLLRQLAPVWRIQLSEWDDHCIKNPHFVYDAINPEHFGIPAHYPSLVSLLRDYA